MKLYLTEDGRFVGSLLAAGGDKSREYRVPTDKNGLIELLNKIVTLGVTSGDGRPVKAVSLEEILEIIKVADLKTVAKLNVAAAARLHQGISHD